MSVAHGEAVVGEVAGRSVALRYAGTESEYAALRRTAMLVDRSQRGRMSFEGDKRVFQDATRAFEIHVIKGLPHADGLVVGYLPAERILVYADMFNLPPADNPVPNPPVVGTGVFLANIERLGLQPERIMSVHSLNPDRLTSVADIKASLGLQ